MLQNPSVPNYKPLYIQIGENCFTTLDRWGFLHMSNPYPALPTPKQPYRNDWLDRDGDDEYVEKLSYEAFEFDVKFYIRATDTYDILARMHSFFEDIKSGEFSIYDEATGLGRQKVRYAGYKEEVPPLKDINNLVRCVFTVTFKVNDPVTFMVYSTRTGKIEENW